MANVLKHEKKQQVVALGRLGWSLRRIEESTGVRRETASRYLRAAGVPTRRPGRWGHAQAPASDPKAAIEVSTDPAPGERPPARSPTASACTAYADLIEEAVRKGRTAMAIWQDLVDDYGFASRYASVRRFVKQLRSASGEHGHPVIETGVGEEAQVDYGSGPMVRDSAGRYRRTRLFVLTLGYSRKSVRLLVFRSSTRIFAELCERAFRRLGGSPRVLVLDNLREGVLAPDIYDPVPNPLFADVLTHYGVVALPCRVRDPNRKGKVESGVGHAKHKLAGLRFESLEEAQAYLDRWEERWADTRIHGTTKRQVHAMFVEEQPHLVPLPVEPFGYYAFGTRKVHLDTCVEVEGAYYSAPPRFIGRTLTVHYNALWVRLFDPHTGQLVREHVRQARGKRRMREEDAPRRTPLGVVRLLGRAQRAGRAIGELCDRIHRQEGAAAVRRIQGVLALLKKHGSARVEASCVAALELGVPTYRFVRRDLERVERVPLTLRQVDPLIRELVHYRDLIEQMSPDPQPKPKGDPE
jgi:transposase